LLIHNVVIDGFWANRLDRRDFVRAMIGYSAGLVLPWSLQNPRLRFAILETVSSGQHDGFSDGVMLGSSEASRTASLFSKGTLELLSLSEHGVPTRAGGVPTAMAQKGAQVIFAALNDDETEIAAKECHAARVIFMNCGARSDKLRRELCSPFVFHVEASEAMYSDARKLAPGADIELWNPGLEKYGASQLNDRFKAAEGAPMTSASWAGWFAIKVIWESLLRANASDPQSLAYYMSSDAAQYDGHKGAPLSFRKWDRQLRQPLYAVDKTKRGPQAVRDIPDTARSQMPARELLDTIGDDASKSRCSNA
jgi:hypothetical protein